MQHNQNTTTETPELLKTPLYDLHVSLGARMVPFAGYNMPVQFSTGLVAEHHHTRQFAGLFDVSHMGQLRLVGRQAKVAFETIVPVDVLSLKTNQQRYGFLTNVTGGMVDDLMFVDLGKNESNEDVIFVIVNGARKATDLAHMQEKLAIFGNDCRIEPLPQQALLALQGPKAATALANINPAVLGLVFMTGGLFLLDGIACFVTRSGYTGEDGFEISVPATHASTLANLLLAQPNVLPIGLGARNSLRLEAGLCLYGQDIDEQTTPVQANLMWAMQKTRRLGGERAGGFLGDGVILQQQTQPFSAELVGKKRVGLLGLVRIPVREHAVLQDNQGNPIGEVTSGLLSPTLNEPIAIGYVNVNQAAIGNTVNAVVRGKLVSMQVVQLPFVQTRYHRG